MCRLVNPSRCSHRRCASLPDGQIVERRAGLNEYAPFEPIVNVPPLLPATALPTFVLTPLIADTVSVSLSGSVSFVSTLPLIVEFSVVVRVSFAALGQGWSRSM